MRTQAGSRPSPTCRTPVSVIAVFRSFNSRRRSHCPSAPTPARAGTILESHKPAWVQWRCDVFTDWVREFRRNHRPGTPRSPAGDVSLPVVGIRLRRCHSSEAGDRPESTGEVPRRSLDHALPRPVRSLGRSRLDLAPDRRARPISRESRESPANGSRSGRSCSFPTGARPSPSHRSRKSSITAPALPPPA